MIEKQWKLVKLMHSVSSILLWNSCGFVGVQGPSPCLYVEIRESMNARKISCSDLYFTLLAWKLLFHVLPTKRPLRWCHAHFSFMYYLDREALACFLSENSWTFSVDAREDTKPRKSFIVHFTLHHRLENCCFKYYQQNVRYVGATPTSLLCTT